MSSNINKALETAKLVSTQASNAISFTRKQWQDNEYSGTAITASDLNRIEQAIENLNASIQSLQDFATKPQNIPVSFGTNGSVRCMRYGNLVILSFFIGTTLPTNHGDYRVLKSEGIPKPVRTELGIVVQQDTYSCWYAHIEPDGSIYLEKKSASGGGYGWYIGYFCYTAESE